MKLLCLLGVVAAQFSYASDVTVAIRVTNSVITEKSTNIFGVTSYVLKTKTRGENEIVKITCANNRAFRVSVGKEGEVLGEGWFSMMFEKEFKNVTGRYDCVGIITGLTHSITQTQNPVLNVDMQAESISVTNGPKEIRPDGDI